MCAVSFHGDNHNVAQVDLSVPNGVPTTVVGGEEEGVAARKLIASTGVGTLSTLQTEAAGSAGSGGFPYGK